MKVPKIKSAAYSKPGNEVNEDSFLINKRKNLFIVADGAGGHEHGKLASTMAIEKSKSFDPRNPIASLENIIKEIHASLSPLGEAATTYTAVYISEEPFGLTATIANIGNTKAYWVFNDEIHQLTEEHTKIAEISRIEGIAEKDTIKKYPSVKNVLTRAVGPSYGPINKSPELAINKVKIGYGDYLVICSDGIDLEEKSILDIIRKQKSPRKIAKELVKISTTKDDKTALVLKIEKRSKIVLPAIISGVVGVALLTSLYLNKQNLNKPPQKVEKFQQAMATEKLAEKQQLQKQELQEKSVKEQGIIKQKPMELQYVSYEVKKGDTLWNIVKNFYGLEKDSDIIKKINEIVGLNAATYPNLKKDIVKVINGKCITGKDGIPGDLIYPEQELKLPTKVKKDSLNLFHNTKFANLNNYNLDKYNLNKLEEIIDFYNENGTQKTLKEYSLNREELNFMLNYSRRMLKKNVRTNLNLLTEFELLQIFNAYATLTNKEAIQKIKELTGMELSISSLYRAVDMASRLYGFENFRKRKNGNKRLV